MPENRFQNITDRKELQRLLNSCNHEIKNSHSLSNIQKWAKEDKKQISERLKQLDRYKCTLPLSTPQLNIPFLFDL